MQGEIQGIIFVIRPQKVRESIKEIISRQLPKG